MLCAIGLSDPLKVLEKKCFDENVFYKISSVVCRVDSTGGKKAGGGKRPAEIFAVAQVGGKMSTWTQMSAVGPL